MKIFSNFDTKFRQRLLDDVLKHFSYDQILVLTRSRYYLYFRVFLHLCGYLVFYSIFLVFVLSYLEIYQSYIIGLTTLVFSILLWLRVGHKFLKYFYDFTIITPDSIFTYKQKGILHSVMKEIPINRIRSIQVSRNSLLENIFQYGCINIHTDYAENPHIEEDNESAFVIGLTYVDNPLEMKNKISNICYRN